MLAEFGTCAVAVVMTAFDHHRLGACNRRRRNRDRAESCKNITKLSHVVFSSSKRGMKRRDKRNVPPELEENSEQLSAKIASDRRGIVAAIPLADLRIACRRRIIAALDDEIELVVRSHRRSRSAICAGFRGDGT